MAIKLLSRVWLPLVVVLVVGLGGYAVLRLHSDFGTTTGPSYGQGPTSHSTPDTKQLVYEVFGTPGAVADINYFDAESNSHQVGGAPLPWSMAISSESASVIGSIVAQGNSDSIGCRILVDGEVKVEKLAEGTNAFTSCLVTGA